MIFSDGSIDEFEKMRAVAVGVSQPERVHEHGVVDGSAGKRCLLRRGERSDAVVEMRNENVAVFVFHAGEQLGQHHRGIRSPVAVVAAVQAMVGAVECDLKMRVAACAEDDGLLSALIDGAVADKPDVSVHQIRDWLRESARDAAIRPPPLPPRRSGCWHCRAMPEAFRASRAVSCAKMAALSSPAERAKMRCSPSMVVDRGLEGRDRPLGRRDGLAVVVRIEDDRVLGAGSQDLAEDDGRRTGEW